MEFVTRKDVEHWDGTGQKPVQDGFVDSHMCDAHHHVPDRVTLDTILKAPSTHAMHATRCVTYDLMELRQHRIEVITGEACAIVILSAAAAAAAAATAADWVFFVGDKCQGRPHGPFPCRFVTVIQQMDVDPLQRARLHVWRVQMPVPWRAHVCSTPAIMDLLHCALHPDAGLVCSDVPSTILLTLVLHHVADAHAIVRRTLDRLACDTVALQSPDAVLWFCLAASLLPKSCVSGLALVTAKRSVHCVVGLDAPVLHTVMMLAWIAHNGAMVLNAETGRQARLAAAALEAPDGSFGGSQTATAIALLARVCTCAERSERSLRAMLAVRPDDDISWGRVLVQSVCADVDVDAATPGGVTACVAQAIAGGMALFPFTRSAPESLAAPP